MEKITPTGFYLWELGITIIAIDILLLLLLATVMLIYRREHD